MEYKIFDLEKPAIDQGFEAGAFDFIIGTNVLHAVSDLRSTLRHIHDLLAPGGNLVFMDVAVPQLWTEAVFGLTSGWWRFTDRDLRPFHPLLGRSQWEVRFAGNRFCGDRFTAGTPRPWKVKARLVSSRAKPGTTRPPFRPLLRRHS